MPFPVNWLAILVAALIPMLFGSIYYHKKLAGNAWMKSLGMTEKELEGGNMAMIFGISFILALILSFGLNVTVNAHVDSMEAFGTFKHGAFHGVTTGMFIVIPVLITSSLFERKNWTNILINAFYWIMVLGVMGGILGVWQ